MTLLAFLLALGVLTEAAVSGKADLLEGLDAVKSTAAGLPYIQAA